MAEDGGLKVLPAATDGASGDASAVSEETCNAALNWIGSVVVLLGRHPALHALGP